MLNVCVLGHSLVPSDLVITEPNVNLEVYRYSNINLVYGHRPSIHFSAVGQRHLREILNRVVRAYLRSDS